ncbi:MAG TPA: methyltransferase domain-containing protein [Pseudonocardiaceae bacterium]|jgi:protein-L-isoaspartate O-methyltransferase|nr:methyltransferase domain-containing protein [Pseudonocardiaceae bacterium]
MTTAEHLTVELADKIPAGWAGVISAVDRATFIPARIWVYDDRNEPHPIDRDTDPQRWWQVVYSDTAVMTQFDNGATVWPDITGEHPTSSASQPSLMLDMLANLDVHEGHRVLEIGTGTGYNAALLAARLGDDAVTTIEIDATVAQQARANLTGAGYTPTAITGDGAVGYPSGAPFDRVVATASVRPGELPYPWVEQTRPGGIIVTPWGPDYHNGILARLVVDADGTASGHLSGNLAFMRLRAQQDTPCPLDDVETGDAEHSTTSLWVYEVVGDFSGALTVGLLVPNCHKIVEDNPDDEYHHLVRVHDGATGSWATVDVRRGRTAHPVRQHGPRRLWHEIERAHAWWVRHGRPSYTRLGVTVTDTEQWAWLDHPGQRVAP